MIEQVPPGITSFLRKDILKNCNILYFIEDNPVTAFYTYGDSILIKGISDREWIYVSSENPEELEILLGYLTPGSYNFAVAESWMIPLLKNFHCHVELTVKKWYLPNTVQLPVPTSIIKKLYPSYSDYILENSEYKEYLTAGYISDRLKNGISGGIFFEDKLAAWGITHDDGAIGFLHVEEKYRRQGMATQLTIYLAEEVRKINRLPFVHIEMDNINSLSLVRKLGFRESSELAWLVKY